MAEHILQEQAPVRRHEIDIIKNQRNTIKFQQRDAVENDVVAHIIKKFCDRDYLINKCIESDGNSFYMDFNIYSNVDDKSWMDIRLSHILNNPVGDNRLSIKSLMHKILEFDDFSIDCYYNGAHYRDVKPKETQMKHFYGIKVTWGIPRFYSGFTANCWSFICCCHKLE